MRERPRQRPRRIRRLPPDDYGDVLAGLTYVEIKGADPSFWAHLKDIVRTECRLVYREEAVEVEVTIRIGMPLPGMVPAPEDDGKDDC